LKIFKSLSRWWDNTHGGEWKIHIDFAVEPGESLLDGVKKAIESRNREPFWNHICTDSEYYKIHLTASIHQDDSLWG